MSKLIQCFAVLFMSVLATKAQVSLVSDIYSGTGGSNTSFLTVYDGKLYFRANDGISGLELWSYDGISVELAADIVPGPGHSNPYQLTPYAGKLFFQATDSLHGSELWSFDGDTSVLEAEIQAGPGVSFPNGFTEYEGKLYFAATESVHGVELWSYDGDTALLVADIREGWNGSGPFSFEVYLDKLYFRASDSLYGAELWSYDGDTAMVVQDILAGSTGSSPDWLCLYDGKLFFMANDSVHGFELWSYDGTVAVMEAEINPGPGGSAPTRLTVYDGKLYFSANDASLERRLWSFDGSNAQAIGEVRNPSFFRLYDGKLFFNGEFGTSEVELCSYDGNDAVLVADINSAGTSEPIYLTEYLGKLYFGAIEASVGRELWSYMEDTMVVACTLSFELIENPLIPHSWFLIPEVNAVEPFSYYWEWGDGTTSMDSFPVHVYDSAGYYTICMGITDANGCFAEYCDSTTYLNKTDAQMVTVNVVSELPNGLLEEPSELDIRIYPNPNNGQLTVSSNLMGSLEMTLLDLTGKTLRQRTLTSDRQELDISDLSDGVYLVRLCHGTDCLHQKIIKH